MDVERICENLEWIYLVWDREMWRILVNAVMKLGFHKRWGIS
jgi:hypothetical protein